jgi:hypothetical protein
MEDASIEQMMLSPPDVILLMARPVTPCLGLSIVPFSWSLPVAEKWKIRGMPMMEPDQLPEYLDVCAAAVWVIIRRAKMKQRVMIGFLCVGNSDKSRQRGGSSQTIKANASDQGSFFCMITYVFC